MTKKTKITIKESNPTWPLYIVYEEHKTGGELLSDEPYSDRTDTDIDFSIISVHHRQKFSEEKLPWKREKVELDFDPSTKDEIYIVVVRYSDGDTFGHIEGCWEIVEVCDNIDKAYEIANNIEEEKDHEYKGYKNYVPWKGYFARFTSVSVEIQRVRP